MPQWGRKAVNNKFFTLLMCLISVFLKSNDRRTWEPIHIFLPSRDTLQVNPSVTLEKLLYEYTKYSKRAVQEIMMRLPTTTTNGTVCIKWGIVTLSTFAHPYDVQPYRYFNCPKSTHKLARKNRAAFQRQKFSTSHNGQENQRRKEKNAHEAPSFHNIL